MPYHRSLLCLTFLFTSVGHADFNSAITAYQNQQFELAYHEFKRLAELGDAPSQRNLAAMYARGEYVEADLATAWAWAKLATESGGEQALQLLSILDNRLKDEAQHQQAMTQADALFAKFGKAALAQRLLPVPSDRTADCSVEVRTDAEPLKTKEPTYPVIAARIGIEGHACLTFYLDKNGRPIRIRAYEYTALRNDSAAPYEKQDFFVAPSMKVLSDWQFLIPATEALREVPTRYCLDYRLDGLSAKEYKAEKAELDANRLAASAGDPTAKYKLSKQVNDLLPMIEQKRKRAEWQEISQFLLVDSARGGYVEAQYDVAANLLTGNQCEKDIDKGLMWLTLAAQQGHDHAQYLLASRLMYGQGFAQNREKAVAWLKAAAEAGHGRAKVEYAMYLLQYEPSRRDEAVGFLPEQPDGNDLKQLEAAALGKALKGDFHAATAFQQQALDIAREVGFETETRSNVLAAYKAGTVPVLANGAI